MIKKKNLFSCKATSILLKINLFEKRKKNTIQLERAIPNWAIQNILVKIEKKKYFFFCEKWQDTCLTLNFIVLSLRLFRLIRLDFQSKNVVLLCGLPNSFLYALVTSL